MIISVCAPTWFVCVHVDAMCAERACEYMCVSVECLLAGVTWGGGECVWQWIVFIPVLLVLHPVQWITEAACVRKCCFYNYAHVCGCVFCTLEYARIRLSTRNICACVYTGVCMDVLIKKKKYM